MPCASDLLWVRVMCSLSCRDSNLCFKQAWWLHFLSFWNEPHYVVTLYSLSQKLRYPNLPFCFSSSLSLVLPHQGQDIHGRLFRVRKACQKLALQHLGATEQKRLLCRRFSLPLLSFFFFFQHMHNWRGFQAIQFNDCVRRRGGGGKEANKVVLHRIALHLPCVALRGTFTVGGWELGWKRVR